jgi:hypothetical protein
MLCVLGLKDEEEVQEKQQGTNQQVVKTQGNRNRHEP